MSIRLVRLISTLAAVPAWTLPSRTMTSGVTANLPRSRRSAGEVSAVGPATGWAATPADARAEGCWARRMAFRHVISPAVASKRKSKHVSGGMILGGFVAKCSVWLIQAQGPLCMK